MVAQPLVEHVVHMMQRSHQRRVVGDVEDVEAIPVARRVHDAVDRRPAVLAQTRLEDDAVVHLRIGDIVALQTVGDKTEAPPARYVCIIRWAISENPEPVELGLQVLAPSALAVEIAHPQQIDPSTKIEALILPATPPLRPMQSLVLPAGLLKENTRRIIVMLEAENLEIREVQATHLEEQTNTIEVFSVSPDDSP